jgi:hypothetical protein
MKKKTTPKKASAKAPKTETINIRVEMVDQMLHDLVANAMALQMVWQIATGRAAK